MKKIISLFLCLVFATFTLVGCGKDEVGDELSEDMQGYVRRDLTLNFYIVGDPENDNSTVSARISNYTYKHFKTYLNIFFVKEAEYQSTVIAALDAAKADALNNKTAADSVAIKNKPDFFLVNSPEMMKELLDNGHLSNITEYFTPELYDKRVELEPKHKNKFHADLIKKCESLKNVTTATLMSASVISNKNGEAQNYCIPNDRVVGEYIYLLIHRDTAEELGYIGSASQFAEFTTWESTEDLRKDIAEALPAGDSVYNYVKVVSGRYEDKAMYENGTYPGDSKKYACSILASPEVAGLEQSKDEAGNIILSVPEIEKADYNDITDATVKALFESYNNVDNSFNSAFAVNALNGVDSDAAAKAGTDLLDRSIEIIHALNTDSVLQNYLQYGVQDTNYTLMGEENDLLDYSEVNFEDNGYFMNPKYTGNMFNILSYNFDPELYCDDSVVDYATIEKLVKEVNKFEDEELLNLLKTITDETNEAKLVKSIKLAKYLAKLPEIITVLERSSWTEVDKQNAKLQNDASKLHSSVKK